MTPLRRTIDARHPRSKTAHSCPFVGGGVRVPMGSRYSPGRLFADIALTSAGHSAYNPPHERPDDGLPAHAVDHLPPRGDGVPDTGDRLADGRQDGPALRVRRV